MDAPSFEPRRRQELLDELKARAAAWLAEWHPQDAGDFATALFHIVARIESEVTERLDKVGLRTFRGFLDWLGVKGQPGLAARLPVVFTMTPGSDPITAPERARLQIVTPDAPIIFETTSALRILPGTLSSLVAVDPGADEFYRPTANVYRLTAPDVVPTQWTLTTPAAVGATALQLDPPLGLAPDMTLSDPSGQQYVITAVQGAIVTIAPPVGTIEPKGNTPPPAGAALAEGTVVRRVDVFTPFSKTERNKQEHSLFIGSSGALNVDTDAWIGIEGGASIPSDATWSYSGKPTPSSPVDWIPIDPASVTIDGTRLLVHKPAGTVEQNKIDGHQSRWLKARRAAGNITAESTVSGLRLTVNCNLPKDASGHDTALPQVQALEGIANTTPLVLGTGFYPLGREPRQFDSFYLGSKEAFSKPSASITLDFALGSALNTASVAVGGGASCLSFAIGVDGRLHGIRYAVSAGTITPSFMSPSQPSGSNQRSIGLNSDVRPAAASLLAIPHVIAASGSEVWLWEQTTPDGEWSSLGTPAMPDGTTPAIVALTLVRAGTGLAAYAVSGGALHRSDVGSSTWTQVPIAPLPPAGENVVIVAPIVSISAAAGEQSDDYGLVVVSDLGNMYKRDQDGSWHDVHGGPLTADDTFYPLTVLTAAGTRLCVTREDAHKHPVAFDLDQNGPGSSRPVELLGHSADFKPVGDNVIVVMVAQDTANNQPAAIAVWDAFNDAAPLFDPSAAHPVLSEAPLRVGTSGAIDFFFSSGREGQACIIPIGQVQYISGAVTGEVNVFTDAAVNWSQEIDPLIDLSPGAAAKTVIFPGVEGGLAPNIWITEPQPSLADGTPVRVHGSLHNGLRGATVLQPPGGGLQLQLDVNDLDATDNGWLYLTDGAAERIVQIHPYDGVNKIATIATPPAIPATWVNPLPLQYRNIKAGHDETVNLRPSVGTPGMDPTIASSLLQSGATLNFTSAVSPNPQMALDVLTQPPPAFVVLNTPWTAAPGAHVDYFAEITLFGQWNVIQPPKPRNPALSWEYFDGTTWRLIPHLTDGTNELANKGLVTFCVPKDLQQTDVVGHKNYWIRARLVGGDYGQETFSVVTTNATPPATGTIQTVQRDPDSISAPYVASLIVTYDLCCPVVPDFVLTHDNGGVTDETDVNRNTGAAVEYFVPLKEALEHAAGGDASAGPDDRALFLGFTTPLTDGPIQVLFLVDENAAFDDAYPLRVDAIVGSRFTPLVATDNTRGLTQTGTLEFTLGESPTQTGLFGSALYWLRVRPGPRLADQTTWTPAIRGAYLNATWAEAADTQTFEQLGSSDGSPNQQFALARTPIVQNTLRLRVFEPLGDEDVVALRGQGIDVEETLPNSNIPQRANGYWVLWNQIGEPANADRSARVYSLDHDTGIITFGDGQHGMIPPIGTNVIVAEQYRHGGGAAANGVTAWTKINLVTPLAGVNAAVPPDGAAGGSDPQTIDQILQFAPANLRVRDRALALPDFEVLALQFARNIGQARALSSSAGVKLVVAMRGRDAQPSIELVRQLRAYLLDHAAPMLGATGALAITGPDEIRVRVELTLVVDTIEWSGQVADDARDRITTLLDAGDGGHDHDGWPFGAMPTDTDIAAALIGIDHLEGIEPTTITRADGAALAPLAPTALVRLAADGVKVNVILPEQVSA